MFDKALQIFAADTVTEANRFAGELTALVDALNANVDAVHNRTVELVTYPFYGPPQSVSLPAIAVTSTVTSTLTATRTGSIEPTGGATATATPTATTAVAVTRTVRLQPTATPRATTVRGLTRRATATRASTPISTPAPTTTPVPTATPQPTPLPPLPTIQSSALDAPSPGTAWRNPVDGAIYLYIPGGRFEMGAEGADAASPKEEPRHAVTVESFWLQQTETTNAQYGRCVDEGACSAPANDRWDDPAFADHPVSNVSWQQAATYAAWAGGRLPTEAEWERSCRSDDGRIYPWGNDDASDQLANYNNAIGDTAPVGSYPAGQSAYGVLDLSGNLWEWTSSVEADYPYDATDGREDTATSAGNRAVRGGSFYYTNYQIRCAARTGFPPDTANEHIGFRIVLTAPTIVVRNPVDGAIYLYIPGGTFEMGAEGADAASPKEEPRHAVTVESFWLQQTETTNAQYGRCVDEGACSAPANDRWDDPTFADHPVSNVSWQQAAAYAAWAGGRLPTEAEWERSCRSDDGRIYPWGNDDASDQLANYNNAIGDTAPVGSYPAGQSAYGVLDLSGNLWEWTSSVEADYPYDATDGREDTATSAGNRAVRAALSTTPTIRSAVPHAPASPPIPPTSISASALS
ncbi:MAG: SUMF1/EgtB/PvdO family nonheme iron enzyme [Caldilineaceae bacterium]